MHVQKLKRLNRRVKSLLSTVEGQTRAIAKILTILEKAGLYHTATMSGTNAILKRLYSFEPNPKEVPKEEQKEEPKTSIDVSGLYSSDVVKEESRESKVESLGRTYRLPASQQAHLPYGQLQCQQDHERLKGQSDSAQSELAWSQGR